MNTSLTRNELLVARAKCDTSLMFFTRFFFKILRGSKFITNWHHEEICSELDSIGNYEYELLNINIPPRCSKTELVLNFIARSLGVNPSANFLYITASDELRSEVSVRIRDIITHPYFMQMYGVTIKKDQNSKNLWRTNIGGGLKTATIFGQITGFGAGQMTDFEDIENVVREFEGAVIFDDINKTDDAEVISANNKKVTRVIFNTALSRKNSADTPFINIQQRSGVEDATAVLNEYYESTNCSNKVKNLVYPAIIDGKSIWEKQLTLDSLIQKRDSPSTSRMFKSQYMQEPVMTEDGILRREWFEYCDKSQAGGREEIFIDGAYTDSKKNDPSGLLTVSFYNNKLYVHDFTEKWLVLPDLIDFISNSYIKMHTTPIYVEPKATGKDIKVIINRNLKNPCAEISERNGSLFVRMSKYDRMSTISDYIKAGQVVLVRGNWNKMFVDYLCNFPHDKHDEACDVLAYAVEKHLMTRNKIKISYGI